MLASGRYISFNKEAVVAKSSKKLGVELENRIRVETHLADFSEDFINTPADHEAADKTFSWSAEAHK